MKRIALPHTTLIALICMLLGTACTSRSVQSANAPENMEMKPFEEPRYGAGVPLKPANDLLMALERARKDRKLVKLPVVVERTVMGRGWEAAYIGVDTYVPLDERIFLRLHDSALGVSLADRIHQYCPEGQQPCKLWLIGYWDEAQLGTPATGEGPAHALGLRFVLGPVEDLAAPLAYIAR